MLQSLQVSLDHLVVSAESIIDQAAVIAADPQYPASERKAMFHLLRKYYQALGELSKLAEVTVMFVVDNGSTDLDLDDTITRAIVARSRLYEASEVVARSAQIRPEAMPASTIRREYP